MCGGKFPEHVSIQRNQCPRPILAEQLRSEPLHAMLAIATLWMNGWVVEEDAVVAIVQLQLDDRLLVSPPIRIVHAGRLVFPAIPGRERFAVATVLPPLVRCRREVCAELLRPVLVERLKVHDRGRTDVAEREA